MIEDFVQELADEPCTYGDNCPLHGTRHGQCLSCKARAALARHAGSWPVGCQQRAFVAGAKWWQFKANGATAFASEVDEMEAEAVRRYGEPAAEPPSALRAAIEKVIEKWREAARRYLPHDRPVASRDHASKAIAYRICADELEDLLSGVPDRPRGEGLAARLRALSQAAAIEVHSGDREPGTYLTDLRFLAEAAEALSGVPVADRMTKEEKDSL